MLGMHVGRCLIFCMVCCAGNILDDEQLINTLNHSKLTSSVIAVSNTIGMQLLKLLHSCQWHTNTA